MIEALKAKLWDEVEKLQFELSVTPPAAAHVGLGLSMHRGNPGASDTVLREEGIVRIYDIFFDYDVLLSTDAFFRKIVQGPEFQRPMIDYPMPWCAISTTPSPFPCSPHTPTLGTNPAR